MAGNYTHDILPEEVKKRLEAGEKLSIIDVREPDEWAAGHIPGAKLIPLNTIPHRCHELDPEESHILVCRSGGRSGVACEYLEQSGYKVSNMVGGMLEWDGEVSFE